MPRLESGSSSSSEGFSISFKVLGLVGLIACGIGYMVYEYVRLFPSKSRPAVAANKVQQQTPQQIFEKLSLTDEQKNKLATLQHTTTSSDALRRQAMKVLTPEQKAHLKNLRAEADAKRAEQKAKQQARLAKYFPGGQKQIAEGLNKQLQQRREQRKAAANAGAGNTSTAPAPATKP